MPGILVLSIGSFLRLSDWRGHALGWCLGESVVLFAMGRQGDGKWRECRRHGGSIGIVRVVFAWGRDLATRVECRVCGGYLDG